jgi:hypothetical protein
MAYIGVHQELERTLEVGRSSPPRRHFGVNCFELIWFNIIAGFFMSSTSLKLVYAKGLFALLMNPF